MAEMEEDLSCYLLKCAKGGLAGIIMGCFYWGDMILFMACLGPGKRRSGYGNKQ